MTGDKCLQKRSSFGRILEKKISPRFSSSIWFRSRTPRDRRHTRVCAAQRIAIVRSRILCQASRTRVRVSGRWDSVEQIARYVARIRCSLFSGRGREGQEWCPVTTCLARRRDDPLLRAQKHERNFPRSNRRRLTFGARETSTCKMSWLSWSTDIKKRACKYLLQRYLGHFLHDLSLDQLTVDLYNGKGQVDNVYLNVQVG